MRSDDIQRMFKKPEKEKKKEVMEIDSETEEDNLSEYLMEGEKFEVRYETPPQPTFKKKIVPK